MSFYGGIKPRYNRDVYWGLSKIIENMVLFDNGKRMGKKIGKGLKGVPHFRKPRMLINIP